MAEMFLVFLVFNFFDDFLNIYHAEFSSVSYQNIRIEFAKIC